MDEANWIFLTRSQVTDAVAFDFRQYGSQADLFARIARRIPGMACSIQTGTTGRSFRVTGGGSPALEIPEDKMGFYLLHLLESLPLKIETLAGIAGQVFQTRTVAGRSGDGIWVEHGMETFACCHCGHCCRDLTYKGDCTRKDVERWEKDGRRDILDRVRATESRGYEIWIDPDTGRFFDICPWLDRDAETGLHLCRIHDVKPDTCREYPFTPKHAAMTGCRGAFSAEQCSIKSI